MWLPKNFKKKQVVQEDYEYIADEEVRRRKYQAAMRSNMRSQNNVWKSNCKHYVAGACHKDIAGSFYVIDMKQPEKPLPGHTPWKNYIYRIQVAVRDEYKKLKTTAYIEFSHTPLLQVCQRHTSGLGEQLAINAKRFNFEKNDCRKGVNMGAMVCTGARAYSRSLIRYKCTDENLAFLETKAGEYFEKYGFAHWVGNGRQRFLDIGATKEIMGAGCSGANNPWMSLCVTTANYGNECHLDLTDACQGITIWHESNPPCLKNRTDPIESRIINWYFIFPDMEIKVDGEWRKGVAIPLQHGTVVSWDARLLRHCTAMPGFEKYKNGNAKSVAFGTYFGIDKKFERVVVKKKAEYDAAKAEEKKKQKAEKDAAKPFRKKAPSKKRANQGK
jgi:hypothetical protein